MQKQFLEDIRNILEEFGINSTIGMSKSKEFVRKDRIKTTEFRIFINRNKDINRYFKQIGFIKVSEKTIRSKERLVFG